MLIAFAAAAKIGRCFFWNTIPLDNTKYRGRLSHRERKKFPKTKGEDQK
jgi:hypothetical protein